MNTLLIDLAEKGARLSGHLVVPDEGKGPGLLLLCDEAIDANWTQQTARLMAEEGYVTFAVDLATLPARRENEPDAALAALEQAARMLSERPEILGPIGLLGYGEGAALGYAMAAGDSPIRCAVLYSPTPLPKPRGVRTSAIPVMAHCGEMELATPTGTALLSSLRADPRATVFSYPAAKPGFACQASANYVRPAAMMAYSRSLTLLRKVLGPTIDLESLWDNHLACEFATKDADATINTMVDDCYVNHVPNMTGGVGREYLHRFYKHHFIPQTPDTELIPISRTVGTDRLVDEIVAVFTHDRVIDWFLPGIPPTGKRIEIACVSIVSFRGRKLYHEHIYWDQASVFVQLGLLDPAKLPVAGRESALKVLDHHRPSNELIPNWKDSEGLK